MRFDKLSRFQKQCKKLSKKYRSLPDDIALFKKVVTIKPYGTGQHSHHIHQRENFTIIKTRLSCKSLKNDSLRIAYAYHSGQELIRFIEIYYKGDRTVRDRELIQQYLKVFGKDNKV